MAKNEFFLFRKVESTWFLLAFAKRFSNQNDRQPQDTQEGRRKGY